MAQRTHIIARVEFAREVSKVASGPIEAMFKATTRRLNWHGMPWDWDNVEAVMAMEAT